MNRARAHIVGVGESQYARWGKIGDVTEHALACQAIQRAVADAGLSMDDVDGLASFADDRNEAIFLAAELGLPALRFGNMVWMPGGGGGVCGGLQRGDGGRDWSGRGGGRLPIALPGSVLSLRHRGNGCSLLPPTRSPRPCDRPIHSCWPRWGSRCPMAS